MPIIMGGYLVVSVKVLEQHLDHWLEPKDRPLRLYCMGCDATVAEYHEPEPTLPCGSCRTQEEHDEGLRLQAEARAMPGVPKGVCTGCYLGDDGISTHDCAIHRA